MSDPDRSRLFAEHQEQCDRLAMGFKNAGMESGDLKQVAYFELWEATDDFDPMRHPGVPFWAYAHVRIRRALIRSVYSARARGLTECPDGVQFTGINPDWIAGSPPDGGQIADAVWAALCRLSPLHQKLLIRRTGLDGDPAWSIMQCADSFGLSVASAKRFIGQARAEVGTELLKAGWDPNRRSRDVAEKTRIQMSR